jgi:hypothetical protein
MRLRVVVVAIASVALAGCTYVPTQTVSQPISKGAVPFGLLARSLPGTNGAHVSFTTQPIYLLDAGNKLTPLGRIVPTPVTLTDALNQLVRGPSTSERAGGYKTAIPTSTVIIAAAIVNGTAFISLGAHLPASNFNLAMAELVYTAHAAGADGGIEILIGGVVQVITLPSGATSAVLEPSDYASYAN